MKKLISVICIVLMATSMLFAAAANEKAEVAPVQEVELSYDELVAAAKAEGKLAVYGVHTYIEKALKAFGEKYGIEVSWTHLGETDLVNKVAGECASNAVGADLVFAQDGARIWGEWNLQGYIYNWSSERLGALTGETDRSMAVFEYFAKGFVYNNEKTGDAPYLTNIWQITDPANYGLFSMKDPYSEGVNFNFLTMLTSPEWSAKLADAYKAYYGKDIVLTTENAGYEFIKALYKNGIVLGTSDTKISEAVGAKGQSNTWVGLFSVQRFATAPAKNLALGINYDMNPVVGFYAPIYSIIPSNAQNINAAKLFEEYMLSEEGWSFWAGNVGDYNANKSLPFAGDVSLEDWAKVSVAEEMQYCFEHRADVEDFIQSIK